jgi:hypothetical protein
MALRWSRGFLSRQNPIRRILNISRPRQRKWVTCSLSNQENKIKSLEWRVMNDKARSPVKGIREN